MKFLTSFDLLKIFNIDFFESLTNVGGELLNEIKYFISSEYLGGKAMSSEFTDSFPLRNFLPFF